jgi:hypothetical protein
MMIIAFRKLLGYAVMFAFLTYLMPTALNGQVTVKTFHDINNNGIQDAGEDLITGLTVTATDANGNEFPLLDDGNGTFILPAELITSRLRIHVTGYDGTLKQGVAGPTSVFYVENGATVLVPVSTGPNFNVTTSRIMIPCYDGGPAEGNTGPAFVSFPYTVNGIAQSKGGTEEDPQMDATIEEIGSTWGVAYQSIYKRAFTAALLKRHVGLGPEGTGGLYMIDYSSGNPVVNSFNLQGVVPSTGPTIDFGSVQRVNVDGDVDETMPYALTTAPLTATFDMDAFPKVGAVAYGDIDVEEDEQTLWMVNLHQRSLIAMDVSEENVVPGTQSIRHYPIAGMSGLPNLNYRYAMCINAGGNLNNTGAEPFTDQNEVAWDKNKYSVGGQGVYKPITVSNLLNETDKTSESPLYKTLRIGTFNYEIPVPVAETYTVTLHFAEPENFVAGDRLFDIKAEGQVIRSSYDIVSEAGANKKAITLTFDIECNDGVMNLEFIAVQGAKVNEALVCGVEVVGQSIMESGVLRPWGLTFHQGFGYLGVVADGSISKSREHLFGFVLRFDPDDMEAGFTEVLAFPLGYPRERASNAHLPQPQPLRSAEWQAWVDQWELTVIQTKQEQLSASGALLAAYAQPIISDINFTSDGGMTIGLMDRWGHQTGYRNYPADITDNTLIVAYGPGDLLRAFDDNGILRLESQNFDNGTYFRNDDGPSFDGEFFYEDHFVASAAHHGEISTGGNAILRGTQTVVNTVFNPINVSAGNPNYDNDGVYTQGIQFYSTATGEKERAYLFVDQYIQGKANGLGDMEFAAEFIGGEVGNYVWCDGNANGIQDPEESGIDSIKVYLYDKENGDALIDSATTENGGQFIFTNLLPQHCYSMRIDLVELQDMGFSGQVPPPDQGGDDELDSDGDPTMIPGFSVAMFCTGAVGENDHSIDFGFLGPQADSCTLFACAEENGMVPCGDFLLEDIRTCVLPPSGAGNIVEIYAGLLDDSLINPITTFPIHLCEPDSIVYARVSLPDDDMCYSIAKVTLSLVDGSMTMPLYHELVCTDSLVDLPGIVIDHGLVYEDDAITFYTDEIKTMMITTPGSYLPSGYPDTVYFNAELDFDNECSIMGSIILLPASTSLIEAGNEVTVCGLSCVDLTSLGASFDPNGSGALLAEWTTSGTGTFVGGNRFGEATMYCPSEADMMAGSVELTLTVLDDPCVMVSDVVLVTIMPNIPQIIHVEPDTIDCTHPFVLDQAANDTFPTCFMVFDCFDTLRGSVIDYDLLIGDCLNIIKQIKRTVRFVYDKQEYFCMDTISVRALPDTIVCPPMRDSVYCDTAGYLKDENGHPSPLVTGFPMADTIPLWPAPPSVCDILVVYKDTEFTGDCPKTIKREWFIKNTCTGSFDTCVQWLMIFDTIGPYITKFDTAALFVPIESVSTHDCFADFYIPSVTFEDTCSGVKMVKATIENYGTAILEYNPVTKCYESHQKFRLPISEIDILNGQFEFSYIRYEALDSCHNATVTGSIPIIIVDRVKPVAICDKGLNVTVTDSIIWVNAESFNEGSWDNCGISMVLARRSDWATACGVDLCDDVHYLLSGEHHDSLWCARMETDKHINPVEAHYQKAIEWLCADGSRCALPILMGWFYDLVKYPTLDCIDHPYPVDEAYIDQILAGESEGLNAIFQAVIPCVKTVEADSLEEAFYKYFVNNPAAIALLQSLIGDYFHLLLGGAYLNERAIADIGKQIGGGWSDAVPFCCEDACQDVTVELLVMDYWCNWSKCWTTVRVEDKTPPEVVSELYDVTITCSSYKTYYAPAVELALAGDFDSLQSVLGRYDKVSRDSYGKVPAKTTYTVYDLNCDSSLVEKDTLVYDDHLGYIWKTYKYYRAEYDLETYQRFNGQIADNCGLQCIEETPWISLDECGNGFIKRVFKFVGQCSDEASGHFADTITRYQTIWVTNDCEITKAMFEVPKDTIIYSCGIEYATDGSGNVGGMLSPEYTGEAQYIFDNDCRLVGIGYYDQVFKIVGGDEACYKVIRTWCFADWCDLGKPIEKAWWFNPRYKGKYITCTQKIIVYDSQPPICTIDEIPAVIDANGCFYNLNTVVVVEDECGLLDYSWHIINTKTNVIAASGSGELNSSQIGAFIITANDLGQGSYKLKVYVTDECQNESVCDAEFVINANKKPTPVCITSLTAELTPMDTDGDGVVDTAMAVVWANEFNVSSQAACGSSNDALTFRIDWAEGDAVLPPATATSLEVGCEDIGPQDVRLYVIDESGSWDYCTVVLMVQDNAQGCGNISQATGHLTGEILTENGEEVEQVQIMVEGKSGVPLWEADDVSGQYSIDVTMGVEAIVRPRKNTNPLNGVSTSDLILIQKAILGKAPLESWYKEQAADANNDGKISALDLIELRKLILGMIDQLPSSDSWRFYERESNKSFYHIDEMLETMRADFVGVKIGDVNGSNDPALKANRSSEAFTLSVNRYPEQERITFRATEQKKISGLQLTIEFDPSKLQIVNVLPGNKINITADHFNLLQQENGWITLSWNPEDGTSLELIPGQEIFSLQLVDPGQVDLSEMLTISSRRTPAEVYDDTGVESGINLEFEDSGFAADFSLKQNRPNPWKHSTAIGFTLTESAQTSLTVYDVNGRMVKQMGGQMPKGYHEWSIDAADLPASGVYYYKLETNDRTAVRKMILME